MVFKYCDLAKNLLTARESAGYTQKKLAEKSLVGLRNLIDYEHGQKSPTVRTLEKLGKALRVPAWELLR